MIPEATVIIPTYDEWQILQECLDCLAQQSISFDRFEVIVANNNASPDVPAFLQLPPNARVLHVPKPGSYAARNAALREARGDALFFTDSDCLPDRLWIENGLAALANLRPIDRIAGAVTLFAKAETWTSHELYDSIRSMKQSEYALKGWCATANLVTRRAAFDLVGPFSENAFSGGDSEWGLRAAEAGSRIVFSELTTIRHPARGDFAALAKKARRLVGNQHVSEVTGRKPKWPIGRYLLPKARDLLKIGLASHLSATDKLRVAWIYYRLRLVSFSEVVRLRLLSGTPKRS